MPLLTPHVPIGLIELMKDLAKEVLRDKPENICEYAVAHFEKLILARDGCMDKGYERFTAYEAHFEGQQRFAVPSSYGYICQKAIKAKAVPQPRKSKSDVMANFQAMESINEEDAPSTAPENTAPKPATNNVGQSDYDEEKYQNAIYVIQRYFRRHVARKRKISSNGSSGETLSEVSAAIIIQRTMRRLFSNKIKLKKETTTAASSAVKLVHDDVDNVSEAASYTSSSTIQMLADGQEGRENRLATAKSPSPRQEEEEEEERQQQREELSDSDGYADGDGNIEVKGKGVGDDGVVAGATDDLTLLEFKEPPKDEQVKPTSSSSPTEAVVVADDVTDEKKHSPSVEAVAANSTESEDTEVDRKSIADENGNPVTVAEENSTHPPPPSASSANDDTSTAQNFGILSTQIGSNYNHQNLSNTKTNIKIDTNARIAPLIQPNPINMTKQVGNIIPAGLSVPLNYPKSSSASSSSLGATPETLPATSPHLEQTQETFTVHRLQEHDNGNENDIDKNIDGSSYFQGKIDDGRMRKFDSMTVDDAGESLKLFDGFQHQGNVLFDQEFSDSLNESTMEKDSLEPEELDVDSLESNENVVHHHMSEIVKKEDASQDDGSLYGDDNDGELDAENVQKFNEIERVPTYLYGIHPARTPIPERKAKNRNPEETRKVPDEQKNLEAVKNVDEREKSEEDSTESKGSSSGESSATQIENNLQHRQEKDNQHGNDCKLSEDNKETKSQDPSSNQEVTDGSSLKSNQQEVVIIHQRDDDSTTKESQEAGKDNFSRETKTTEEVRSDASVPENLRARRETKMFIDSERGLLSKNKESTTFSKEETFIQREKVVTSSTTYHSEEIISKEESKAEKISTDHLVTSTKSVKKSSHEENKTTLSNETLHRENKSTESRVNTEVVADLVTSTKSAETSSHQENKTILSNQTLEDLHNRENKSNEERVDKEVVPDHMTSTKSIETSSDEENTTILSNKTPRDLQNRENKSNEEQINTEVVDDLVTSTKSAETSLHEENKTILSNQILEDLHNRENKSNEERINTEVVADLVTSTKSAETSSHEENKTIVSKQTLEDLHNRENKSNEERVNTEVVADLETSTKSVEPSSHEDNNTILSNKTQEDLKNREHKSYEEYVNPEVVAVPREESKGLSKTSDDQPDRILDDHDQEVLLQFQELQSLNDDEVTRTNLDNTQNEDTSIHKILEQNDLQVGNSTAAEQTQHQIKNLERPKNLTSEKNSSLRGNVSEISEESQVSLTEKEDRLMNKEGIIQVHDHSHETEEQINGLKTVDLDRILKTTTLEEGKDVGIRVKRESDSHKTLTSQSSAVEEEQRAISDTNISKTQSEKLPGSNESSEAKKTYEFGDLNRQSHDDKPSTRTTNSDPINEIETRKKELQDLSEADKVVKESKDEILEKDSGLEDLDTLDEKVSIKEDSSSPDFLGSTVEKERLQDRSQIIDDQGSLELKSSPEPKEDQREIKSLEKENPKPFAEAMGTQNMSKEKEKNKQHPNNGSDKAPHSEIRDQDEENNKITENNCAESEILKKEVVDQHEEKKVSEGIETAKGSEEVKVNGTQLLIISNDKETTEEEPVSAKNDSLSTKEPLKKIDQENLDQSSSPENVGYAESSAETSADFSSIGKDLDFFEDTIKYLKNATEHLGEMDDVFDIKESSGQKSIRDSELLKHSAVLIQSAFRGYQVRRDLKELNELEKKTEDEKAKEDNAAIKIQSAYRGHRVRRSIKDQVVEDNTGVVTSLAKEEFPSPSRDILATNAARSQIPVAVIHPTKYPSSDEESPKKKLTSPSQRSRSVTHYHPSTSSGNKSNTRSSPSKTVTTLRRQKPVEKRPTITKKSTIDESSIEKRSSNDSLDQTVKINKTTLVLNRKPPKNGNKSKNLRIKTQSANDVLEKTIIGSTSVKDQFKAKGKSLSTNGNRAQSRDSFDLEAIKKELLSNTAKSPPQAGKKKKPKSGKRSSPKKQPKGSRIPQKSPKTILTNKQAQPSSGNEDHETSNETNLSKTFIKETEETVSNLNEEKPGTPKKTLNKTYTVRSSLNEIEGLDSSLSARHENASEDLFDSLKKDVDKLKSEVQEKSAVTIQKTFRGYKTRKFLKTKGSGESLSERTIKSSRGSPVSLETIVEMPLEKENEIESSSKELLTANDDQPILEEASIQQSNLAIDEKKHEKEQVDVRPKATETQSDELEDNKQAVEGADTKILMEASIQQSNAAIGEKQHEKEQAIVAKESSNMEDNKQAVEVNAAEKTAEGKKEKSAIVIQKTFRGYQSRKQLKSKKDDENISVNKEENPPNPTEKLVEDSSGVFKTLQKDFEDYKSSALNKSATAIQKHFRGFRTRKMLNTQTVLNPIEKEKGLKKDVEEELSKDIDESTVKTEKRANINEKGIEESPRKENKDRDKYATTIQKNYRGYRTRKQLHSGPKNKELTKTESLNRETEPLQKPGDCDRFNVEELHKEALEKSATTIQRSFRGYQTRKRLQSKELPVVPEESFEGKDKIEELRKDLLEDKKSSVDGIAKLGEDLQNVVVADHTSDMLTENKVSNDSLEEAEGPDQDNREIRLEKITEETNLSEGTINTELARDKEHNEKADGIVKHSESKDRDSQKSNHSLSAGAVLENAASTIQKAFRDYQSKKINHPTKSYSNGFQRGTTTPKEILENSDESSTFIGPDTSFDLSDVDSVETRSEKTLNYDKVSSSEAHTPVNSGEEGDRASSLRDLEIESETTPQKLRLKRSLIEPTAPPQDEILPAEDLTEVKAASPKLKWFVGEEPIVPSDSSAAESSVIPLISSTDSTSNIDDLSSFDACFDTNSNSNQQLMPSVSKTNNSAVVSTSSLLLTNNTEINDKNSLYTTSEIVSANEEEKKDFKKEEGNLENEKGDEEKVVKLEVEEDIQAETLMKSGSEGPEEDRQVDTNKEVPTDLCKNCAEGKHEGGAICSGNLIKSQKNVRTDSEQSDQIKQFVLMEEEKTGSKTEPAAISSGKDEANIENQLPANAGPNEEVNSSADCPVISFIPPSSEDTDTSERDASLQDSIKTQDPIIKESEQVKSEGLEESENHGSDTIKSVTVTDEDLATTGNNSLHSKEGSLSKEEKLSPKEVGLTNMLSSEGQDSADQSSISKQSSNKNDSLEDPFKTRPGEELSAQEKGFEDDFSDISDSKDLEEASAVEIPSSKAKSQANQVPKETAGSVVKSEESEDTANHEDLIEKFVKLEEKSEEELKKSDNVTLEKEVTLQEKVEGTEVVQNVSEQTVIEGSGEKIEDLNDDRKEGLTAEKTDKNEDPKSASVDEEKLGKEGSSSTNDEGPTITSQADSQMTNEDQEEKDKERARKLQEDKEIAAKLIEIGLSDPLAKILEKESKLAASEEPSVKDDQSSRPTNDQPDSPTQAKLEQLIEDHSKPPENLTNTVDPKDLPIKNASQEVEEVPCVKKVISPPPDSPDESELESTTTKADSSPTTPGYDETSETDAPDASKSDNLLAMTEKLREPEEMVARMQQRRASEQKVSLEIVTDPQVAFEEPICEPIKPMEKIQKSSSTDVEDDLVLQKLQRGDTTRESSAQSESVVFGDTTSQSQITESEDTFNENLGLHSLHRMNTINESRSNFKPPSHLFKSVTIDDTVKYIDPEKSTEESGSSFCMDDALSEDVRKKMMAYSVSEADSDYYDVGDHQTGRPHDDFNISTALDTFPSTDTDTTIISAATKIQAGARGFLTRRRIRRASMGTKASLTEDKNVSFGNAAIGESLDQLAEEDAGRRQFNRTTGVNSLPSALEHSDEILSPRVDGTQIAVKSSEHLIKIENVSSASSTENDVNLGLQQPFSEDDSFQMATSLEATVARRLTLQRGDALRNDSTPDDENGNGKQVDFAKNTSSMTVHEKTTTTTTTTMTKTTTERRNYSDAAITSKKDTIKWFALRQNSMPVQIDSEVFRVLPKHMRKRIKSAEGEKPKRIRLPRD